MAKFVISLEDGKFETPLEGEDGEEVTPEMVAAYAQMQMGWALAQIAKRLADLDETVAGLQQALKEK